jgi:hypothetical protein
LYDLQADPDELHNLASDPRYSSQAKELRAELEVWMRAQSDQQKIFGEPRLLSDRTSFGPNAEGGDAPAKKKANP